MSELPGPDPSRRAMIKTLVKGALYASPVIVTLAAPARLLSQGPSVPMMTFCDYFPILCMWFGGAAPAPGAPTSPGSPGQPAGQPAPWQAPPPGRTPPPGQAPPGTPPRP